MLYASGDNVIADGNSSGVPIIQHILQMLLKLHAADGKQMRQSQTWSVLSDLSIGAEWGTSC